MSDQYIKDSVATCVHDSVDLDWLGDDGLHPTTDLI
jgi:hypothetical protein